MAGDPKERKTKELVFGVNSRRWQSAVFLYYVLLSGKTRRKNLSPQVCQDAGTSFHACAFVSFE